MKIRLLAGIGGFPMGSQHRVIAVVPHGGHTDDSHQYLIQGQVYVPASKAIEIPDVDPGADKLLAAAGNGLAVGQAEKLQKENADLKAKLREMALQSMADDVGYEAWITERDHLLKHVDRLERENIDLKNQLADLRHEVEMNGWLK